jgi:hypothetical protein
MSALALRVLPYSEAEHDTALLMRLPARLMRPEESNHQSFQLSNLKNEIKVVRHQTVASTLSRIVENNGEPPTFPGPTAAETANHANSDLLPSEATVKVFAVGIFVVLIGLILLLVLAFTKNKDLGLLSASCLVVGTGAVALSLLRGQDRAGYAG